MRMIIWHSCTWKGKQAWYREAKGSETEREATSEKRKETLEGTWQLIDGRIQVLGDFFKFFVRLFYWIDKLRFLEEREEK